MTKNNKKHKTLSLRTIPLEELIRFARENFDKGSLRIARDAFKELVRIDKARFLPELLICYNRMAEQMIANQQINEAKMLIELIKELGGEKAVTVTIDPAAKSEQVPDISMLSIESEFSTGHKIPEDLKFKAADWAIAKREIPETTDSGFLTDRNAVAASLTLLCSRDFDRCSEQLKSISFDSPFSQWKLLIRGMISYYKGDDCKAETAFLKIVPDTVPSKMAKVFLVLLNHSKYLLKTDSDREETIGNVCVLSGYGELKECLPRAHYFWTTNRYRDSLNHMQSHCESFPSIDQSIVGTLSTFYYNCLHTFTGKELSKYLPALYNDKNVQPTVAFQKKLLLTEFLAERSHGNFVLRSSDEPPEEVLKTWEHCYKSYMIIYGHDPLVESEIYLKLGSEFLLGTKGHHNSDPYMDYDTSQLESLAETCLQKSLELTKCKEAYILLMQFYRNSERKKDCRVLIEDATKDFPSDKELLMEAGLMARARDAHTKAIEYLERAYEIDKIDSDLRKLLILTFLESAKKAPKSKYGLTKMRSYLSRAEQLCTTGSQGFLDEPAYIKIRRAGLEFLRGNQDEGNKELQQAYNSSINPLKLDFFSLFIFKALGVPPPSYKNLYSNVQMVLFAPAKIEKAMMIIQVVSFVRNLHNPSMFREDFIRIFTYVTDAIKKGTFTPQDFRACYTLAEEMKYTSSCELMVNYAIKAYPDNPLYHFYKYKAEKNPGDNYNYQKIKSGKILLEKLIESALDIHDLETAALIRKELESLAHAEANLPKSPFPFDPSGKSLNDLEKDFFDMLINSDFDDDDDDCDGDCANCDHCDMDDDYPPKRKRPTRRKKAKQKR